MPLGFPTGVGARTPADIDCRRRIGVFLDRASVDKARLSANSVGLTRLQQRRHLATMRPCSPRSAGAQPTCRASRGRGGQDGAREAVHRVLARGGGVGPQRDRLRAAGRTVPIWNVSERRDGRLHAPTLVWFNATRGDTSLKISTNSGERKIGMRKQWLLCTSISLKTEHRI